MPAFAETGDTASVTSGDFKDLKHTQSSRIDKVIDGRTILLKNEKIVTLLGLDYPMILANPMNSTDVAAKDFLNERYPEGTEIMLYQTRKPQTGRMDRMGHLLAHLAVKETGEWINGTLIENGYAYAITDATNPEMTAQLYTLEEKARALKNPGIWQDAISPVLTPDTAAQGNGTLRIVEGRIVKSATSNNNLYLNFGNDYRKDFTVMITPSLRKILSHRGIDPMSFSGQTVRVRGWIRDRNGPFMELETPERLEILSPLAASVKPEPEIAPSAAPMQSVNP